MDIVTLQQELRSAGFSAEIGDINNLVAELKRAIASGKVKQSTAPSREYYPIGQVVRLLLNRDDTSVAPFYWEKAIKKYPQLENYKVSASYSRTASYQKNTRGVASLKLEGVIILAFVLGYNPRAGIKDADCSIETVDARVPVRNGYIYVLQDNFRQVLKVGVTADIEARLRQHKTSNPFLIPIVIFPVESRDLESELHRLLEFYRIDGLREWYTDCLEVRQIISNYFWLS